MQIPEELVELIHQTNVECGEVLSLKHLTSYIMELENACGKTFSDEQIIQAWRDGGEKFVDSMQGNEYDTEDCVKDGLYNGHPIDSLSDRLMSWEAMRPSVIRAKHIESITL
jgi:hypothetical protein